LTFLYKSAVPEGNSQSNQETFKSLTLNAQSIITHLPSVSYCAAKKWNQKVGIARCFRQTKEHLQLK